MKIGLVHLARGMDGTPASPMVDHLGLESIAGMLQEEGHDVILIDSGPSGMGDIEVLGALCGAAPDLIGFAINYVNVRDVRILLAKTRRELPNTGFVAGGHYATFHAEQLLRSAPIFDAVVIGEGEQAMTGLARHSRAQWGQVPGLALLIAGQMFLTKFAPPLELDELPPANRSVLSHMAGMPRACVRVAVEASRGCVHNCSFCSIAACQSLTGEAGHRRIRSPQVIKKEMASIVMNWGLKDFWFMDAEFLGNAKDKPRIIELAGHINELGHDLSLEIDARADSVDRGTISALRSAGLERCFLGVESFDQTTLNSFSKGSTVRSNLRAIDILLEENVRPILGTILFHPASTMEQIARDHEHLSRIGYEKTQLLFRLKKYKGSADAGEGWDCEGRGVSHNEDYGWEIVDPKVRLIWELFDFARLRLMDVVFIDMTAAFRQGKIDAEIFQKQSDKIFHSLRDCMDVALDMAAKVKFINRSSIESVGIKEIDSLLSKVTIY